MKLISSEGAEGAKGGRFVGSSDWRSGYHVDGERRVYVCLRARVRREGMRVIMGTEDPIE